MHRKGVVERKERVGSATTDDRKTIREKEKKMKQTRKTWIALLLGALLLATLVGVVWARPKGEFAERDAAHKLDRPKGHHGGFHYTATIPGGHFHPIQDGLNWYNWAYKLRMDSGSGAFTAALPILPGSRTVESMTMYVMDNHASVNACVSLVRAKTDGSYTEIGSTCSAGSSSSIRTFSDTTISPSTIWGGHGAYLYLSINGTNIDVYSVQVAYY